MNKLRKIILSLIVIFLFGCTSKVDTNPFKLNYQKYELLNSSLDFDNAKGVDCTLNLNVDGVTKNISSSFDVFERGYNDYIYNVKYKENGVEYSSYYDNELDYINNNNEKYIRKTLLNAYKNFVLRYVHLDFETISITGIESITVKDDTIEIMLNESGIIDYFNDVYYRNKMSIEPNDYKEGKVSMELKVQDDTLKSIIVEGEIQYKQSKATIKETISLREANAFEKPNDIESYIVIK